MRPINLSSIIVLLILAVVTGGLLLPIVPARADFNMTEVGAIAGETWKQSAVFGTTAYVAAGTNLTIVDVTDPANPAIVRAIPLAGSIDGVTVSGTTLYVACGSAGLLIYSLADPLLPAAIATWPFEAHRLHKVADRLYVCGGNAGLMVLNVANPAIPVLVSQYSEPGTYVEDIETAGLTAYVGCGPWQTLWILDAASNPATLLGSYTQGWPGAPLRVAYNQGRVYSRIVNFEYADLLVFDVTNPANPRPIGSTPEFGNVMDITWRNQYLHVFHAGLSTYDVSAPDSPVLVQEVPGTDGKRGTINGNTIYEAMGEGGLRVLDLPSPTEAIILGACDVLSWVRRVTVDGDYLYASGDRLWVVDIADITQPRVVANVNVDGFRTIVSGHRLYVAGDFSGLIVLDITDPASPVVISADTAFQPFDIRLAGTYLYATDRSSNLRVFDLDDPDHPELRGSVSVPGAPYYLAVDDDYAYVADLNYRLRIVDVSNPDAPVVVNSIANEFKDLECANGRLYAAAANRGLEVYDLANPAQPALVGSHDFPQVSTGIDVQGNRVFIGNEIGPISVLDATDPAQIVELGNHTLPPSADTFAYNVTAHGNYAIASLNNSLRIYQLTGTAGLPDAGMDATRFAAAPNPTRGTTMLTIQSITAGPVTLTTYDAAGRRLQHRTASLTKGTTNIIWTPTTDVGTRLAPGLYFLRADTPTGPLFRRLTVLP